MAKRIIKKYWLILFFALLINLPIFILGIIRTNYEITNIGNITDISNYLSLNDNNSKGSFNSVYVVTFEKSTILQNMLFKYDEKLDIDQMEDSYIHITDIESYNAGQIQKKSSIDSSIIYAYKKANKEVNYSYLGLKITYYNKNTPLRIGDLLYKINDVEASIGRNEFRSYLSEVLKNDELDHFTIKRNNEEIVVEETNLFYGYDYYDLNYDDLNPKINIKKTNTGGPSAGFMQALAIYNQLTDFDYTRGLKICGTGTININGTVGIIGGIKQKIYTAYLSNVDIFLCPEENYEEAKKAYDKLNTKMKLIKVSNFDEAINYLYEL